MFLAMFNAKATLLFRFNNEFINVNTNQFIGTNFTSSIGTITNMQSTYGTFNHTFQVFNNAVGTNTITFAVDRSIDTNNWVAVTNLTWTTATNWEYTTQGNWVAYRFRITALATNDTIIGNYMAR